MKSAIGIGSLLEDGIGDTIRVSLTEDPEFEVQVCKDLVRRYQGRVKSGDIPVIQKVPYSPFEYKRRVSRALPGIGGQHVPVVMADFMQTATINRADLRAIGYNYDVTRDKWNIGDAAADYLYTGKKIIDFDLPGTLKPICDYATWLGVDDQEKYLPLFQGMEYDPASERSDTRNFISLDPSASA